MSPAHTHTNRPPFLQVSFTLSRCCYMVTCLAVEQRHFPSFSLCVVFSVLKIKDVNLIVCATKSSSQTSTFAPVAFLSDCFQTGLIDRPDSTSVLLSLHLYGRVPADCPHQPSPTDLLRGAPCRKHHRASRSIH